MMIRMKVVLKWSVDNDSHRRFDNLNRSYFQNSGHEFFIDRMFKLWCIDHFFPEYYWLEGLNNPYSFFWKEKQEGSFGIQQHCSSRVSVFLNL